MNLTIQSRDPLPVSCKSPLLWVKDRVSALFEWLFKKIIEPLAGYLLKICLFRLSALQDRFSRWIVEPLARAVVNLWMKCQGIPNRFESYDPVRLAQSAAFLSEFAEIRTAATEDGKTIQWALYTPEKFEEWIEKNGGVRDGEWIRPRTEQDWSCLQRLRQFKWFEEKKNHSFRVPPPIPGASNKCILRCNGFGRTIPMDKAFIGLHLAAGFKYAVFDWRDEISIKGFFQDAEAIYQKLLQEGMAPQQIKAMGSCRATFPAARLKELHHKEGLDAVLIHAPPSLRAVVAHSQWPSNKIGLMGIGAIEKDGADFDTLRRLRSLEKGTAATCLIMNEDDQTLPPTAISDLKAAAEKSGPCDLIIEPKNEGSSDPHFEEPLRNPIVLQRYFAFLAR